ncbi:unnamed protein product [Periconia digitata]|uniref:Uncharacterized protein n=1 Tax=Periconia digitata TaxID=1303443 RepID=A0A9W4XRQ6_9PLEO|nr:unnamed protein product [Periconia digitata]
MRNRGDQGFSTSFDAMTGICCTHNEEKGFLTSNDAVRLHLSERASKPVYFLSYHYSLCGFLYIIVVHQIPNAKHSGILIICPSTFQSKNLHVLRMACGVLETSSFAAIDPWNSHRIHTRDTLRHSKRPCFCPPSHLFLASERLAKQAI